MFGFRPLESFIRGLMGASPSNTQGRSPVPEMGTPGSVRGVLSNGHPYRNPAGIFRFFLGAESNRQPGNSPSRQTGQRYDLALCELAALNTTLYG